VIPKTSDAEYEVVVEALDLERFGKAIKENVGEPTMKVTVEGL